VTQATTQLTVEEYLSLDAEGWLDRGLPEGICEYNDGGVVELSPESEPNDWIANYLMVLLSSSGAIPPRLIRPGKCEIAVPVLSPRDRPTRYPDLVVLKPEHIGMVSRRLTIRREMPPPQLVVEVVSPGAKNNQRDYEDKRDQYQARGIPEFWLIDPEKQEITVLFLEDDRSYSVVGMYRKAEIIFSPTFPSLTLTAHQILTAGEED
jgi:Uma2 family endonuclease